MMVIVKRIGELSLRGRRSLLRLVIACACTHGLQTNVQYRSVSAMSSHNYPGSHASL